METWTNLGSILTVSAHFFWRPKPIVTPRAIL